MAQDTAASSISHLRSRRSSQREREREKQSRQCGITSTNRRKRSKKEDVTSCTERGLGGVPCIWSHGFSVSQTGAVSQNSGDGSQITMVGEKVGFKEVERISANFFKKFG